MFEFDHSLLSLVALQRKGIRSTRALEQVVNGVSLVREAYFENLGYTVFWFIGFTASSQALEVAGKISDTGKLVTLDAEIPSVEDIINSFCKKL